MAKNQKPKICKIERWNGDGNLPDKMSLQNLVDLVSKKIDGNIDLYLPSLIKSL